MLWKKTKPEVSEKSEAEIRPLSDWERFTQEIFGFYAKSRQELLDLERWDSEADLKAFLLTSSSDLKKRLAPLRESFFDARRKELSMGRLRLASLRDVLWGSIDQICTLVASQQQSAGQMQALRKNLQTALEQDRLDLARKGIQDVINSLVEMERGRTQTLQQLQSHFQGQIVNLQSELQSAQKELQLDGLTQVYNRATFDQHLRKVNQLAFLTGEAACLIMFDIDHFKKVNDTFGHPTGDRVIQAFAKAIVQSFPRRTDFVARFGGEEFAVILQGTEEGPARELLAKCLGRVRGLRLADGQATISFTSSAGLASYTRGENPEAWLNRADRALYQAKELGRDRMIIAAPK